MSQDYSNSNYAPSQPKGGGSGKTIAIVLVCGCLGLLLILALIIGGILYIFGQAVQQMQPFMDQAKTMIQCQEQATRIVQAMRNYHDKHGSFPPAYTVDEDGNPLQSWRVLILPELGYQDLYDKINLEESWESETNRQFHEQMPHEFSCPASITPENENMTSYKWIIGPNTISDGSNSVSYSDVTKPQSSVIVLVEVVPNTNWMEPVDIPEAELSKSVGLSSEEGIGSSHMDMTTAISMEGTPIPQPKGTKVGQQCNIR